MADTNIYYGSGIGVAGNIDIGAIGLSADSRLMVKTRAGLDELKAAKRVYDGMIVYCEADETYHKCRVVWDNKFNIVSCSWTEVVIKSEEELESLITHATTAAMEFKGATATLPKNPAQGDMYKVAGENINITIDDVAAKIGDSIVYNGTQWFLIPSGDDIKNNTTYEFEGKESSSKVSFKVKPSDGTEETIYLDSYSQKEINTRLDDYVTSKSIEKTLGWITNVQSGDTPVEQANKASFADEASYAESAGSANTAGSAGTATRATQDINGNNIVDTYATKSEVAAKQDKLESGVNIKTINGQSLLESGDLVLNADGSISTNPDWNQNDETKIDYIKNRTHYEYEEGSSVYIESVVTRDDESSTTLEGPHSTDVDVASLLGKTAIITIGSNQYEDTVKYGYYEDGDSYFYYVGDWSYLEGNDPTYCIMIHSDILHVYIGLDKTVLSVPVTLTISDKRTNVKQLDEKYIPDTIARKDEIANTYALNTRYEGAAEESFIANNSCIGDGEASFAEGWRTRTKSAISHVEGLGTITNGYIQHVQGKYNELLGDKYAHIIGNGQGENERSNAHTVDWEGNAWYAGKITASEIQIGNTVFTEEQLMKILKFIETVNVGGNN